MEKLIEQCQNSLPLKNFPIDRAAAIPLTLTKIKKKKKFNMTGRKYEKMNLELKLNLTCFAIP